MEKNEISMREYLITKQLTKHPNQYPDAKSQPHVQVAKRLISSGKEKESNLVGHFIHYLICKNEDSKILADKAIHPNEFHQKKKNG